MLVSILWLDNWSLWEQRIVLYSKLKVANLPKLKDLLSRLEQTTVTVDQSKLKIRYNLHCLTAFQQLLTTIQNRSVFRD